MKKTLLSAIAVSAVIGTANAAPTVEQRRAMCEDFGDVWVQETEACIPANPCESDDEIIRTTYCNTTDDKYPLESAEYHNYADCVAENPSDEVDCVVNEAGMTWALASFPTMKQTGDTCLRPWIAWAQIGTKKDLAMGDDGCAREHNPNKPIPGADILHYRYKDAYDWYEWYE